MDKRTFVKSLGLLAASTSIRGPDLAALERLTGFPAPDGRRARRSDDWALNMDVIESCSCPVFCRCFFVGSPPATPAIHPERGMVMERACRFQQVFKVNEGHVGSVRLEGVRFWFMGNGGDFSQPKNPWAIFTFDSGTTDAQRAAMRTILARLSWFQPDGWESFRNGPDAAIDWAVDDAGAHLLLGGGRVAEIVLKSAKGKHGAPVTVNGLGYFGFPRSTPFRVMPSTLLVYRQGPHAFEYKDQGTDGFHTTVDARPSDYSD